MPVVSDITVVGAGLVGSLLSIVLARRGHKVRLYDRRADLRTQMAAEGRSINLAISVRGLHAAEQIGLREQVLKEALPMTGRMLHAQDRTLSFQPYGKQGECIYSISRAGLNKMLLNAAEAEGIACVFQERLIDLDPTGPILKFRNEKTGAETDFATGVLFAADGANSGVREALAKRGKIKQTYERLNYGYKELVMPATAAGGFALENSALHIWPRGNFMLIALPNLDGSFTCTLFLPYHGPDSFESLSDFTKVHTFFSQQFPDALERLPDLEQSFFVNPVGEMVTVHSSPWNLGGECLLLGDAAHAIVPFFGQGMNAGFEDVTELARLYSETASWEKLFQEVYTARKANTDAIAEMAVENFLEMRDKCADAQFQFERKIETLLQQEYPEYVSRYRMVSFTRIPYAQAQKIGNAQNKLLKELSKNLTDPSAYDRSVAQKGVTLLSGLKEME